MLLLKRMWSVGSNVVTCITPILIIMVIWLLIVAGVFSIINLSGCKTFEPTVWNDQLPPECNMSLNTYKLYYGSADKSAAVPSSDFCYKVLQRLRCQCEVFGVDKEGKPLPVDYNNASKYRDYAQCRDEIR